MGSFYYEQSKIKNIGKKIITKKEKGKLNKRNKFIKNLLINLIRQMFEKFLGIGNFKRENKGKMIQVKKWGGTIGK